jgi:GLPGLI family protein
MKSIFKTGITCLALFLSVFAIAQKDFHGKAYYFSKTTMDADMMNFGGRQMSADMKKRISERMKSMLEKSFELTFNKTESLYKEEEKLAAPGQGGRGFRFMGGSMAAGDQYKNVKDQEFRQEQEFFGKQFLIKDELPKLEWRMESETKQIGQYTCYKATAVKQVPDQAAFFRGRGRGGRNQGQDNKEMKEEEKKDETPQSNTKEIIVTAWYTPQVPVNQGPGEYWGLPGLILEVNVDRTTILCTKIVLNPEEKENIKVPSKGKEVTQKEFEKITAEKMEEMRENFQRRGSGGNRRF